MKKIPDTYIASQIGLSQQTFARWKKNRKEVYSVIRKYFEEQREEENLKRLKEHKKLDSVDKFIEEFSEFNNEIQRLFNKYQSLLEVVNQIIKENDK